MTKLALLTLAALTAPAFADGADPVAPPPPPAAPIKIKLDLPKCKASGTIMFQMADTPRRRDGHGLGYLTNITVDTNGWWTFTSRRDGKVERTASGCISRDNLAAMKSALKTATWKSHVDLSKPRCMAYAVTQIQYRAYGKVVLTRSICDGVELDAATTKTMETVEQVLGPYRKLANP